MQESGSEEGGDFLLKYIENPEALLTPNPDVAKQFLEMTSAFFEETKKSEIKKGAAGNLDKLHTEGCGAYSLWLQIKLQNDAVLKSAKEEMEKLKNEEEGMSKNEEEEKEEAEEEESSDDDVIKRLAAEQKLEDAGEDVRKDDKAEEDEYEEDLDYDNFEYDKENGIQNAKLDEDDFNEEEEEEEEQAEGERGVDGKLAPVDNEEEDDDEVAIALAGGHVDDKQDAKHMTYADFFGDDDEEEVKKDEENSKLEAQISEIEKKMMEPKPWQLMGETTAKERPKDALLDLDLEFSVTKTLPPDPLTSEQLEALLIKRIESMQFDDVVRKKKPVETTNKIEEISTVKSKKSLVELYEDDIRNKHSEFKDEVPQFTQQQRDAIEMWKSLEHELNKFTERRFIARRPHEKVEVTQMANVDAESKPVDTKTPEQVMKPTKSTKDMKGESEWTHEERRSRRKEHKEWYGKRQEKRDAEKGILYNSQGKDGAEVKILQDVKKLAEGKLQGIETYQPGQTIPAQKEEKKDVRKNYLL